MKTAYLALASFVGSLLLQTVLQATVTVSVDFTDARERRGPLWELWGVANRISPTSGVTVRPGMSVNVVRMIGGVLDRSVSPPVPDLDFDTATFDESTGTYVYHFDRLFSRIDAIIAGGTPIHQIVLDQPPWAFQRGYTFIPTGTRDGVNFREDERISIYGNSLPPFDKAAYSAYLSALIQALIDNYGLEQVRAWRFRIGSEIETPEHWYGTEQDFIEFFALSEQAIRAVLPDAIIGLHTRHPDFVFRSGSIRNYKNEVIKSFADGLIEYCHDHGIRYDFWGISDYPIISQERTRRPHEKFSEMFADLVSHPKWQSGTILDVEEFSVVSKIQDNILVSSVSPHADTFFVAMSDHFYETGVASVFQWGQRTSNDIQWRTEALTEMVGQIIYRDVVRSDTPGEAATVGVIATRKPSTESIDLVLYNYNSANLEAVAPRDIETKLTTVLPAGTTYFYRRTLAGKDQHAFYNFMENEPPSGWLNAGFTRYGSPDAVLNEAGLAAWEVYEHPTPRVWTEWTSATTVARPDGMEGSIIEVSTTVPLFAFEKIEIRWTQETPGSLALGWDQWTLPTAPARLTDGLQGSATRSTGSWSTNFRGGSSDGTFGGLGQADGMADVTVGTSPEFHYTGLRSQGVGERSIDFSVQATAASGVELGAFHMDLISRGGSGAETWSLSILEGSDLTPGLLMSGPLAVGFDANVLADINVSLLGLEDARLAMGESATFRLTLTTADSRAVDVDNVGLSRRGTIINSFDSDHNQLPDHWEIKHLGAKGQQPDIDGDGDGFTHLQEYQFGTDPDDFLSALRFTLTPQANSIGIQWQGVLDRAYTLESTENLSNPDWQPVGDTLLGTDAPLTGSIDADSSNFFRLRVELE